MPSQTPSRPMARRQLNVRVSQTARRLLDTLVAYHGIGRGDVVETLIRTEARRLGLDVTVPAEIKREVKEIQTRRVDRWGAQD